MTAVRARVKTADFTQGSLLIKVDLEGPGDMAAVGSQLESIATQASMCGLETVTVTYHQATPAEKIGALRAMADALGIVDDKGMPILRGNHLTSYRLLRNVEGFVEYNLHLNSLDSAIHDATKGTLLIGVSENLDDRTLSQLRFCVYELAVNTFEHGMFSGKTPSLSVAVRFEDERIHVTFKDNAGVFITSNETELSVEQKIATGDNRGLGLHMLRRMANDVTYRRIENWNMTSMVINRRSGETTDFSRRNEMDGFKVETPECEVPGVVLLKPVGSIDTVTAPVLESHIEEHVDKRNCRVVIDFSDVDFISSAGVGIFLGSVNGLRNNGGDLIFMSVPPHISEVFDVINVGSYFTYVYSVEELASLPQP